MYYITECKSTVLLLNKKKNVLGPDGFTYLRIKTTPGIESNLSAYNDPLVRAVMKT